MNSESERLGVCDLCRRRATPETVLADPEREQLRRLAMKLSDLAEQIARASAAAPADTVRSLIPVVEDVTTRAKCEGTGPRRESAFSMAVTIEAICRVKLSAALSKTEREAIRVRAVEKYALQNCTRAIPPDVIRRAVAGCTPGGRDKKSLAELLTKAGIEMTAGSLRTELSTWRNKTARGREIDRSVGIFDRFYVYTAAGGSGARSVRTST